MGGNNNFIRSIISFFAILLCIIILSCRNQPTKTSFPYNLNSPNESFYLPSILNEISGLSYYKQNQVLCVQDELGIIFIYDLSSNKIINQINFGDKGDYEGIILVKKTVYVINSKGDLFEIKNFINDQKRKVKKYKTCLKTSCNAEGLCFDEENNSLLIGCKNEINNSKQRYIYAFDLKSKKTLEKPILKIDESLIKKKLKNNTSKFLSDKLLDKINSNNSLITPSALAIHPITNDLYILSALGKTITIISKNGTIKNVAQLSTSLFKQAEGITFDQKGTMYIANEGKKGKANIKVFYYKNE